MMPRTAHHHVIAPQTPETQCMGTSACALRRSIFHLRRAAEGASPCPRELPAALRAPDAVRQQACRPAWRVPGALSRGRRRTRGTNRSAVAGGRCIGRQQVYTTTAPTKFLSEMTAQYMSRHYVGQATIEHSDNFRNNKGQHGQRALRPKQSEAKNRDAPEAQPDAARASLGPLYCTEPTSTSAATPNKRRQPHTATAQSPMGGLDTIACATGQRATMPEATIVANTPTRSMIDSLQTRTP